MKITKKLATKLHEGTRRKDRYKYDCRGLIHQTPFVNRPICSSKPTGESLGPGLINQAVQHLQ